MRFDFYLLSAVFFCMNLAVISGVIFGDALFLSHYPGSWLSYLFFANCIITIFLFTFLIPWAKKGGRNINRVTIRLLFLFGLMCAFLLPLNFFWLPFIASVYCDLLFPILYLICFDEAKSAWSIREFKKYANQSKAIGSIGTILAAFSAPYLTSLFGSESLLYVHLTALCAIDMAFYLKPQKSHPPSTEPIIKGSIWHNALLQVLFPMSTFIAIGFYISDYLLKNTLSATFTRDQISIFLGYFLCILNLLSIFIYYTFSPWVLKRYGVMSLYFVVVITIMTGAIVLPFNASLVTLSLYSLGVGIAYQCFFTIAAEMSISPLPLRVQIAARATQIGFLAPLGIAITACFFWALVYLSIGREWQLIIVCVFSLSYCIAWYYLILKAKGLYQSALEEAIKLRPFTIEPEIFKSIKNEQKERIAVEMLQKGQDRHSILGLLLLKDLTQISKDTLEEVIKMTVHQNELVAIQAFEALKNKKIDLYVQFFIEQLITETRETLNYHLSYLLLNAKMKVDSKILAGIFTQEISQKQIYLIPFLFMQNSLECVEKGLSLLRQSISDPREEIQLAAAKILGEIPLGYPELELCHMISSPSKNVSAEAIKSATKQRMSALIPQILMQLKFGRQVSQAALQSLVTFGEISVPYLAAFIQKENRPCAIRHAINILVSLPGEAAEEAIIQYSSSNSDFIRNEISFHAMASFYKTKRSDHYKKLIYKLIFEENYSRLQLKELMKKQFPRYITHELTIKLHAATMRCLYWYGSYVASEAAVNMIIILRWMHLYKIPNMHRMNLIIEALNTLAPDYQLHQIFSTWENEETLNQSEMTLQMHRKKDPYFDKLMSYYYREKGENVDDLIVKLVVLREVKIFENLSAEALYSVAAEAQWQEMTKGDIIFYEGDEPTSFFIIASGKITLTANHVELQILKEFDSFGEIALIKNTQRMATATASENGQLLTITQVALCTLVEDFPEIQYTIMNNLISYLQDTLQQLHNPNISRINKI